MKVKKIKTFRSIKNMQSNTFMKIFFKIFNLYQLQTEKYSKKNKLYDNNEYKKYTI